MDVRKSIFADIHAPNEQWLALREPEPALEPDLPIIDTHLHLWDFNGHRYGIEQYLKDLDTSGHNITASVFVECFQHYRNTGALHLRSVGETEFAAGIGDRAIAAGASARHVAAGIVAYADLTLGDDTREALMGHLQAGQGKLVGVRQRAKWDADPVVKGKYSAERAGLYLEPAFGKGLEILTELGLSFDASIYHPQIPDVTALAQAHPDARIVLIHCGSPVGHGRYAGRERENHIQWLSDMKQLARCPNVMVKMGGILMNLANFDFTDAPAPPTSRSLAELWRPYIEPCIELFGAKRCMVSSNFPVDKAGFSYRTLWNMFKRITAQCSADEKAKIYSATANDVYRLNLAE